MSNDTEHAHFSGVFEQLHHICIVVEDLEAAVDFYTRAGIGPWHEFPSLAPFAHDLVTPDNDDFLTTLSYRWAEVGPGIQLQLCEPKPGNTPQRAFLESHGPGVFHMGFSTDNVDQAEERATTSQSLDVLLHGRAANGAGFTYFNTRADAGVVLQVRQAAT